MVYKAFFLCDHFHVYLPHEGSSLRLNIEEELNEGLDEDIKHNHIVD